MPRSRLRVFALFAACLLASAFVVAANAAPASRLSDRESGAALVVPAKAPCITIGDKRICLEVEEGGEAPKKKDEQPAEQDGPAEQKKTGNICEGEIACPPGYVVLDKPNKYGACCEPKEGFPAPAKEPEKCKFGMVGTPPNCECPFNSVFSGYRGCLKTCCGTPSTDPKYSKVYVQCHADAATALSRAVALAKANGDPGTNVTCELTSSFPPEPDK